MSTDTAPHGVSNWHDVLESRTRRTLIFYLAEVDRPVTLSELARYVTEANATEANDAGPNAETIRRYLRRRDVLDLAEFGVVEHDPETGLVQLADGVRVDVPPPEFREDGASGSRTEMRRTADHRRPA